MIHRSRGASSARSRASSRLAGDKLFTVSQVILILALAGLDEQAGELFDASLENLNESTGQFNLLSFGEAAVLTGRDETLRAIEPRLDDEKRRTLVVRMVYHFDQTENLSALEATLDLLDDPASVRTV